MIIQRFNFKSSHNSGYYFDGCLIKHVISNYQDIKIIYNQDMGHILLLDDKVMITEKDEYQYHELITHPNCLQLSQFEHALIIGGGDGLCAEELLKYPFKTVTQVEIDPIVSEISQEFFKTQLGNTFQNPKFITKYQDALTFFNDEKIYNYISLDLTDPDEEYTHSNPLYSGEFYNTCKEHLYDNGIIVVQIACPYLFKEHFKRNIAQLKNLFKYTALYGKYMRCYGTYQYFLACSSSIAVSHPNKNLLYDNMKLLGIYDLKLYNPDMHISMLTQNNEIISILSEEN